MKKCILIVSLALMAGFSFGQTLQKGNLLGLHVLKINLKPNVTMDQVKSFYITKMIPGFEKEFQGMKGYLVQGIRGENKNSFGILWVFESATARERYYQMDELTTTEEGKQALEKVEPLNKELEKLAIVTAKFTDWVIQ